LISGRVMTEKAAVREITPGAVFLKGGNVKKRYFALVLMGIFVLSACSQAAMVPSTDELASTEAVSRSVSVWHLEDYMKNATSLSSIYGVYWSARDMDSSPIGNHHFITFIYSSKSQADSFAATYGIGYKSYANQKGLTVYYTTIGGFTDNGKMSGNIVLTFNEGSDVQAVKEQVNPKKYIYWYKPDYDYEAHRVPYNITSQGYTSTENFMKAVTVAAQNFNRHHAAGTRVAYSLIDENCACMVNSVFRALGVSSADRETLGEFTGVDWGEEDYISSLYFDTTYVH